MFCTDFFARFSTFFRCKKGSSTVYIRDRIVNAALTYNIETFRTRGHPKFDPDVKQLASEFTSHIMATSVALIRDDSDLEIRRTELDMRSSKTPDTNKDANLGHFETEMSQQREMSGKSGRSSQVTLIDDVLISDVELENKLGKVTSFSVLNETMKNAVAPEVTSRNPEVKRNSGFGKNRVLLCFV